MGKDLSGTDTTTGKGKLEMDVVKTASVCNPLILIAEDVAVNMELAQVMISQFLPEARFIGAVNGREAVTAFREHNPDLVLMDIHMPVQDGYSAAADIRDYSDARGKRIPVIALTARAVDGEKQRCLESGIDDIITKPIYIKILRKVLLKYFDPGNKRVSQLDVQENDAGNANGEDIAPPTSIGKIKTSLFLTEGSKIAKFLNMALPVLTSEMECLEKAANSNNFEDIETAAHKIRGVALNFSCERLASLTEKIENMKPGKIVGLSDLVDITGKEVTRVKKVFYQILDTIKSNDNDGIE